MLNLTPTLRFFGASPFASEPVIVFNLKITSGTWESSLPAIARLADYCSDWFVDSEKNQEDPSLQIGAFLADWALQALVFVRGHLVSKGCRREADSGDVSLWVGYHDAPLAQAVVSLGMRWLKACLADTAHAEQMQDELDKLWNVCRRRHPDYQARIIMEAAQSLNVPYARAWDHARHWRFGEGQRSRVLFESSSSVDGHFGARVAGSKASSKRVLRALGIPTPAFRLIKSEAEVAEAAQAVGFPCVIKPIDRGGGKGVSAGLVSIEAAQGGFRAAREVSRGPVLVEAHLEGEDHRLMVVEGRFVAAIRREPPTVTGDGQSTIKELVAAKNIGRDPRSLVRSGYFRPIRFDASALLHLAGQGLQPETVLSKGQVIRLRSNANLSTGGICIDVTHQVHPEIRSLVESLGQTLQLSMMGADYITADISRSPHEISGGFVEINTTPGLEAMIAAGWPAEKAGALALSPDMGAVPKTLIIVTEDRFHRLVAAAGKARWPVGTGWASRGEATVSGAALRVPEGQGWIGVEMLLGHRAVGRAILFASDRDILRLGVPVVQVDHLVLAAHLPDAWTQVLSSMSAVVETPEPIAEPEDLIEGLLARLADQALLKEGVLA